MAANPRYGTGLVQRRTEPKRNSIHVQDIDLEIDDLLREKSRLLWALRDLLIAHNRRNSA